MDKCQPVEIFLSSPGYSVVSNSTDMMRIGLQSLSHFHILRPKERTATLFMTGNTVAVFKYPMEIHWVKPPGAAFVNLTPSPPGQEQSRATSKHVGIFLLAAVSIPSLQGGSLGLGRAEVTYAEITTTNHFRKKNVNDNLHLFVGWFFKRCTKSWQKVKLKGFTYWRLNRFQESENGKRS